MPGWEGANWDARTVPAVEAGALLGALAPAIVASAVKDVPVMLASAAMEGWQLWARLACQVALGGLSYLGIVSLASRDTLAELLALTVRREQTSAHPPSDPLSAPWGRGIVAIDAGTRDRRGERDNDLAGACRRVGLRHRAGGPAG